VHVPISATAEAFGQTYVEALASHIPSVFTLSGIANEFISHGKNALVVPYCDSDAIFSNMKYLLDDRTFAASLAEAGYRSVAETFDIHIKIGKLEKLYGEF
jgi:glycosyltransferase involved in cell wall biosynthesis